MQSKTIDGYKILSGTAEKLFFFVLWLGIALVRPSWLMQGVLCFVGLFFLVQSARSAPNRWMIFLISVSFIIVGTIGLVVVTAREPYSAWVKYYFAGIWWGVTPDSFSHACNTALKAINGMLAIQFAIYRFTFAEALAIARFIRLPNVFLEIVLLSYRYLFSVKQCASEIMMAQRQRMGYNGFRTSLRSFSILLTAVFVKSLRFSMQNYQAMTVRAYNGGIYQPHQWYKSSPKTFGLIVLWAAAMVGVSYI